MKSLLAAFLLLSGLSPACAAGGPPHHASVIREYEQVFTTYPYSDPDPVPSMTRFYPYFRYDGFTDSPVQKKWKVVELSNDYLQLLILPEIGGKIWAAIDKSTSKSFVYYNHVVKFRDVSMRGPWTSGGVEPNYGIMGHTPNCFSPVDYLTRRNADGSASCFIGVLDLLTRSVWRLEINLPAGQAVFTTRSLWHNRSGNEQPYYTWMNVGIKASGNLEFINPGTSYLGHDGVASAWPINPVNSRDLSWYERNDFGSYKSYHVTGALSEFFGGYWHDEDFGMAHYAPYADKPGRKIWIWGLSREGMIWEKLLTDTDGQYVEVQSGRLFNQAAEQSSRTPFKVLAFAPYATDSWLEHWFPVKGIQGFVSASPWGALNVVQERDRLIVRISPVKACADTLQIWDGDQLLLTKPVKLQPLIPFQEQMPLSAPITKLRVCFGGDKLQYSSPPTEALSRPLTAPAATNSTSAYGFYLQGRESARRLSLVLAEEEFQSALKLDPNFGPALVELATLANRRDEPKAAREYCLRALQVDTYDPGANYQLGLASVALGRGDDAEEAFSIASLSPGWRSAASLELAKVFFRAKRYERARSAINESLLSNPRNLDALQLLACQCRLQGDRAGAKAAQAFLLQLDPLNHFVRAEAYLRGAASAKELTNSIGGELPQETYLELAAWYHRLGLDKDGARILEPAPPTAEVCYWLAYLRRDTNLLVAAERASPAFVFPFRNESGPVFEWAAARVPSWQPKYYLALLRWYQGRVPTARELLAACGEEPQFAPFYAVRAQLSETNQLEDLQKAAGLDPGQWRYGAMIIRHYLNQGNDPAALIVASDYSHRFATNGVLAVLYAKALLRNARYADAVALLDALQLLPCEGSTEAHALFRESHLMLAVARLKSGAGPQAQTLIEKAREWPEHLGAGKPYPADVDERLEDWLAYQCELAEHNSGQAQRSLDHLLTWAPGSRSRNAGEVLRALAVKASGRTAEAQQIMRDWLNQEPSSEMAKWGLSLVSGDPVVSAPKDRELTVRVLQAWLAGSGP